MRLSSRTIVRILNCLEVCSLRPMLPNPKARKSVSLKLSGSTKPLTNLRGLTESWLELIYRWTAPRLSQSAKLWINLEGSATS
jgi:hypothetical protein